MQNNDTAPLWAHNASLLSAAILLIERLQREAKRALNTPEVMRRMEVEGTDIVGNEAREFGAEVKAEYEKWRALVKKTGMKY